MAPAQQPSFESSNVYLEAGSATTEDRGSESTVGEITSMIFGGGALSLLSKLGTFDTQDPPNARVTSQTTH